MKKTLRTSFLLGTCLLSFLYGHSQNSFFSNASTNRKEFLANKKTISIDKFRASILDVEAMKKFLWSLPQEKTAIQSRSSTSILTLPMPDGTQARFNVWESSIQEPALAEKFQEIKTFAGQGIDDPSATIRFDFNPYFGFSAQILSVNGRIFIDPFARKNITAYMSYFARDYSQNVRFECKADNLLTNKKSGIEKRVAAGPCVGTQLRTYRLAFSCTGEFAQAVGAGMAGPTHASIVTGVNRLTQVYESELSIRLILIANNNLIEYLDPETDPFENDGNDDVDLITPAINLALNGNEEDGTGYDVGHLGCTKSDAGLAYLSVVCRDNKAGGLTGGINPVGDPYYIDFVAHELGHQFSAEHTFNSHTCSSSGGSYEPGSGTTIMAYAGICAATENIQPNSDPIFHASSFDEIQDFVSTGAASSCATITPTGNNLPVITSLTANNLNVPIGTPFTLDATATDADGDLLTYCWEGLNIGQEGSWTSAASSTTRPLFRTRLPKTTGSRTFPDMRVILANFPLTAAPAIMDGLRGELLPTVARTMKFRLTVRDNRAGGGGVVSVGSGCQTASAFQVNAIGNTPFAITFPNGGDSLIGGSTQTITWDNAATDKAPFEFKNVKITLSTDGGTTYPITIVASTANDGKETVELPTIMSSTVRIRVEPVGAIFFDISNSNFVVTPHLPLNQGKAVVAYPIPNNGNFKIELKSDLYTNLSVRVFDRIGRLLKSQELTGLLYGDKIPISLPQAIQTGLYYMKISGISKDGKRSSKSIPLFIAK